MIPACLATLLPRRLLGYDAEMPGSSHARGAGSMWNKTILLALSAALMAACSGSSSAPETLQFSVEGLTAQAGQPFIATVYAQTPAPGGQGEQVTQTKVLEETTTVSDEGIATVSFRISVEPMTNSLDWYVDSNENGRRDDGEVGWAIPLNSGDSVVKTSLAEGEAAASPNSSSPTPPPTCSGPGICGPDEPCPNPAQGCYLAFGDLWCCYSAPFCC